jgi:hypothetical protein
MNYIAETLGEDVLQDWDNFFENRLLDYYTTKEKLVGEWFAFDRSPGDINWVAVDANETAVSPAVQLAINNTRLGMVLRSLRQQYVFVGCLVGPGMQGNPYNLPAVDLYIVNIYDKTTQRWLNASELTTFVGRIANNAYGKRYKAGPIIGLIEFKTHLNAVNDLPDGNSDTTLIEDQLLSSLDMLTDLPSLVNPAMTRQGVICSGLYGYTFNYS